MTVDRNSLMNRYQIVENTNNIFLKRGRSKNHKARLFDRFACYYKGSPTKLGEIPTMLTWYLVWIKETENQIQLTKKDTKQIVSSPPGWKRRN